MLILSVVFLELKITGTLSLLRLDMQTILETVKDLCIFNKKNPVDLFRLFIASFKRLPFYCIKIIGKEKENKEDCSKNRIHPIIMMNKDRRSMGLLKDYIEAIKSTMPGR